MIERDYIMRLVQQLAAVMRRILRLQEQEKYDQAQQEVEEAYGELLGLERELLISLAPATAAPLLGEAGKIKIAARLLQADAELAGRRRDPEAAYSLRSRALELYLEARPWRNRLKRRITPHCGGGRRKWSKRRWPIVTSVCLRRFWRDE